MVRTLVMWVKASSVFTVEALQIIRYAFDAYSVRWLLFSTKWFIIFMIVDGNELVL